MRTVLILLTLMNLHLFALEDYELSQKTRIKVANKFYVNFDINISSELEFLGSFDLDETNKTIDIYNTLSNFSLGNFLLVSDGDYLYILDTKKGKEIGKLSSGGIENYIQIVPDKKGHAKILYNLVMPPDEGGLPYMAGTPEQHELVYRDGVYRKSHSMEAE